MPAQRARSKRPGDATGIADEKLKIVHEEELLRQAESMAMVNRVAAVQNSEVVDLTEEARLEEIKAAAEAALQAEQVPVKKRKYRVRVIADVEDMTLGKHVITPAEVGQDGEFKDAHLGGLNTVTLREGRQYDVDEDMYNHLKHLGYLYGETCNCLMCQQMYGVGA